MSETGILWSSHGWELRRDPSVPGHLTLIAASALAARGGARLERMAEALRGIDDAHLVGGAAVRRESGTMFLELDDPGGETLAAALQRGPLEPHAAWSVARDIALALRALHEHGLVHRALCPELVFLGVTGARLCPVDSVKPEHDAQVTRAAFYIPSRPPFTAPELLRQSDATKSSDAWALGVLIYQAVVGDVPLHTSDPFQYEAAARAGLPAMPAHAPAPLRETYRGLTAVRPADRWSIDEALASLAAPSPQAASTAEGRIRLRIGHRTITTASTAVVGRADPSTGHTPDIDLTEADPGRTVSRRHARLSRKGAQVEIEDLDSHNGTHIAGSRIRLTTVRPGTTVRFGSVDALVELE